MKAIKIILALVVTAVITFFVFKFIVNPPAAPLITPPINQFTVRIEQEVDSMQNSEHKSLYSVNEFYDDIQYRIDDYHKSMFFGSNQTDNDVWHDILSKNLYSAYAPRFVVQAYNVFSGSEWERRDRDYISREVSALQSSIYLTEGNDATQLKNIRVVLNKFNEIASFIWNSNNISYSTYSSFPINDVKEKIDKASNYKNELVTNNGAKAEYYVKNSNYINNGLESVPRKLFEKHVSYLNNKITNHSKDYEEYDSQQKFNKEIFNPINEELKILNNEMYIFDIRIEYNYLENKLNDIDLKAYKYFQALSLDNQTYNK